MAKRKSSRKKQNNSSTLLLGGFGMIVLIVLAVMVFNQPTAPATAAALPSKISVEEAYQMQADGAFVLDVRTPKEWAAGHVPGATLIPLDELAERVSELPQDEEIVVICRSGNRSAQGRDILLDAGFVTVTSVSGGFNQWVANGFPSEVGE